MIDTLADLETMLGDNFTDGQRVRIYRVVLSLLLDIIRFGRSSAYD